MAVAAYRYAEAAPDKNGNKPPPPNVLDNLAYIDRFGVKAITGREVLSYKEITHMLLAENVVNSYVSRKHSQDWPKWAEMYPQGNDLLIRIEKGLDAD